ncbi:MAG: HAD family hydrolase [Methylobacteriaceae bacterium]|nr:HAD family hydrolase [Methylobacteriaceae bacterium]
MEAGPLEDRPLDRPRDPLPIRAGRSRCGRRLAPRAVLRTAPRLGGRRAPGEPARRCLREQERDRRPAGPRRAGRHPGAGRPPRRARAPHRGRRHPRFREGRRLIPRPTAILFDKDGTLIDFNRTWGPAAYGTMEVLAEGDRALLEQLVLVSEFDAASLAFRPSSPLVAGSSAQWGPLWAEVLGEAPTPALLTRFDTLLSERGLRSLAPIGEPRAVLARLARRGLPLGIATNDAEASARAQAEALGIQDLVGYVAGYDSGHGSKPDPGMVTAFARAHGLPAGRVAMVGDSTHDLVAARAAGAIAVAVLTGPRGRAAEAEIAPLADAVLGSIGDLEAWLDGLDAAMPLQTPAMGRA